MASASTDRCTLGFKVPSSTRSICWPKDFGKLNFKPGDIEYGNPLRFIERGEEVDIRIRAAIAAGRGAEQREVNDAGRFQFGFVFINIAMTCSRSMTHGPAKL